MFVRLLEIQKGRPGAWLGCDETHISSRSAGSQSVKADKTYFVLCGQTSKIQSQVHENAYEATAVLCLEKSKEINGRKDGTTLAATLLTAQVWLRQTLLKQN